MHTRIPTSGTRPRRRAAAVLATSAVVVLVASSAALGQGPTPSDPRQRVSVEPAAREMVLAEMRRMLESVNGILSGVAQGDLGAVERAARAAGTAIAVDVDPGVMAQLPQAFRALGMATHRAFDALADRTARGGTREDAIADLARITASCVACHATYRLDERR